MPALWPGHATQNDQPAPRRLPQFDSVRGLAALFVVFNHAVQVVPESVRGLLAFPRGVLDPMAWTTPWPWLRATPLRLVVGGQSAVVLFFVLSGFVLALGVTPAAQPGTAGFLVKRICRIYIPFAVVAILALFGDLLVMPMAELAPSLWSRSLVQAVADPMPILVGHLLMGGGHLGLNPVVWTLVHEVRASFLMPLIFLSLRHFGLPVVVIGLVVSLVASVGLGNSITSSWQATIHFLWLFVLGAAIAMNRIAVARWGAGLGRSGYAGLFGVALLLMAVPFDRNWCDFLLGGGAGLLIALCLTDSRAVRLLLRRWLQWLGRVSYSLYLVHLPILVLLVGSGTYSFVLYVGLSLLVAELVHRLVEVPAHRLGLLVAGGGWLRKAQAG